MKNIKIITTDLNKGSYWQETAAAPSQNGNCAQAVRVWPQLAEQRIEGFGGAFTEASVHTWQSLPKQARKEVLEGYFGQEGLRYNMGRTHINSCDFALGNYTYVEEGDKKLDTFSIAHDREHMIPMIQEAMRTAGEEIAFLASPWSPPSYMKTNGEMNHGGKLKEEYYGTWAQYYVRYIEAYAQEGIKIRFLTVQNEPAAVQTWDSCIYDAGEEGLFVRDYLAPALLRSGHGDVEIFVWDHNKEIMVERAQGTFDVEGSSEKIAGVAVHWYTGDHFDAIRAVKKLYPDKRIFFTEGCVEFSRFGDSGEVQKAEMYAHDMLGDLKAGTEAYLDWNLLLDAKGGPNHVGNFCAAPMMLDAQGLVQKHLSYYYIGHFSRYIRRGAVQVMSSAYSSEVENVAFTNPDGSRTVVLLNRSEREMPVVLMEKGAEVNLTVSRHSIVTVCYQ